MNNYHKHLKNNQMKKSLIAIMIATSGLFALQSCGENEKTDLVESGTYQGTAEKVNPGEKEIYVRTPDNKLLELYLTDSTALTKGGVTVPFDSVKKDGKLEVKVEKKGNKLAPIAVTILKK
jgi:CspA family cold shock protein